MKVAKFGGSSVADAGQFKKVKEIVKSDSERQIVVVSAAGKSPSEKIKVTDLLIELEQAIKANKDFSKIFNKISSRILKIKADLGLEIDIEADLKEIASYLNNCSHDYLVSRGEFLTGKLMAKFLGYYFVDAKDILIFDGDNLNYELSSQKLDSILKIHHNILVPGFYGSNSDGSVHLMPRGGSDITGAILANLVDAQLYENWTDVSGILMADPRIVDHSKKIDVLTYEELQELSYMGVGVFQEEAVRPVRQKNIPTEILNTNCPNAGGTLVVAKEKHLNNNIVTGIAGKKDYIVITIKKYRLSKHLEVLQRVLAVFQRQHISIDSTPSGNDGFSFLCQRNDIGGKLKLIIQELKSDCGVDAVNVRENIALVAAVSLKLSSRPAIAGRILNYLDESLIKVKFVFQDGSDIKVVFGVNNEDYEKTIEKIYHESINSITQKISA
ncbi:aspartate kinase [Companilactobacillus farciminis]|nr:aspartate kinase [Companilactobacillus farciminis]